MRSGGEGAGSGPHPDTKAIDARAIHRPKIWGWEVENRLARLRGHVGAVGRMVEEERCADEILLQVAAVKAALNKFSAVLIDHELKSCVETCMSGDSDERLKRVTKVLSTLLGQS